MKYLIIALLLCSCYSQKKATVQHGKAVATYPEIGADYCARTYPPRDSLIKGDSVLTFDTIYVGGEHYFDTVLVNDTLRITKTVILPAKVITQRVVITDTVKIENTAALDLCNIEKRAAVLSLDTEQNRADKYQAQAKKYLLILIGMAALGGLLLFFRLRKKSQK